MALVPGTRLGPYEIVASLGAGGMGEVYRARDTRLGRHVALKVLPQNLALDAEVRARLGREARALAALNHPHIAAIHDVVDDGGELAIVMELVEGRTLKDLLAEGALTPSAALSHAIAIADALAAAHAAGIVHRDLKPANVIVSNAGSAKVLDFGIAKVQAPPGVAQGTTDALTGTGSIVGTLGYMAPEQVHGRPVDGRSDIFSFGVLVYEMLAGRRAFQADSAAGMLSAVLRDDPPPLGTTARGVPRAVERITGRCLQKDPRHRYQTAADLKIALEDARDDLASQPGEAAVPAPRASATGAAPNHAASGPRWRPRLGFLAAGAALGAAGVLFMDVLQPGAVLTPRYRPFITEATAAARPTFSPDGRSLAYVADVDGLAQLFVRSLDAAQPMQLTRGAVPVGGNARGGGNVAWSADGTRLYFGRAQAIMSVGVAGGEAQAVGRDIRVLDEAFSIHPDGRVLVFVSGEPGDLELWTLDVTTGQARALDPAGLPGPIRRFSEIAFSPDGTMLGVIASTTTLGGASGVWLIPWPDGPARHHLSDAPLHVTDQRFSWMPDSRRIVFNASPSHESASRLFIGDTVSGDVHQLTAGTDAEFGPAVSPDGSRIAFVSTRAGLDLIEVPVDGGPPVPVLQSSRNETYPDLSSTGVLAFITDAEGWPGVRVRSGGDIWSQSVGPERQAGVNLARVRLSPDGHRIAVDVLADEHAVWIYPVSGGTPVRLDRDTTDQHGACWSPDGNWLAYRRLIEDRWQLVKAPVGGGVAVRLAETDAGGVSIAGETDWSPTGEWIAYTRSDGVHLVAADGTTSRVLAGRRPSTFRFSRDGVRLFALQRGEHRRWELATWDVGSGRVSAVVALPIPASAEVQGLALSPDESRIIVGAGTPTSDIWLLEEFEPPAAPWTRWWPFGR